MKNTIMAVALMAIALYSSNSMAELHGLTAISLAVGQIAQRQVANGEQKNDCSAMKITTASNKTFTLMPAYYSKLGVSWKNEDNLVWGSVVKDSKGQYRGMTETEAKEYCASRGARLPTYDELWILYADLGRVTANHTVLFRGRYTNGSMRQDYDDAISAPQGHMWTSAPHRVGESTLGGNVFGTRDGSLLSYRHPREGERNGVRCVVEQR